MDVKSRTIFYLTAVFQVSINLGREGKIREGEKKSEERREMAPGCSTERRPPPRWRIKGQRGSRLLHKRLRDPRARYFSPSFPSAGRGNRLRKARARQVWQINEIPAATVNNNTTVPANQAVASSCRPIFSDYKCHGCSTAGERGGRRRLKRADRGADINQMVRRWCVASINRNNACT